jgi:hypothetical protein
MDNQKNGQQRKGLFERRRAFVEWLVAETGILDEGASLICTEDERAEYWPDRFGGCNVIGLNNDLAAVGLRMERSSASEFQVVRV